MCLKSYKWYYRRSLGTLELHPILGLSYRPSRVGCSYDEVCFYARLWLLMVWPYDLSIWFLTSDVGKTSCDLIFLFGRNGCRMWRMGKMGREWERMVFFLKDWKWMSRIGKELEEMGRLEKFYFEWLWKGCEWMKMNCEEWEGVEKNEIFCEGLGMNC